MTTYLGLVLFAYERRENMAIIQVVIFVRAIQIGGHGRYILSAILQIVAFIKLDTHNLNDFPDIFLITPLEDLARAAFRKVTIGVRLFINSKKRQLGEEVLIVKYFKTIAGYTLEQMV